MEIDLSDQDLLYADAYGNNANNKSKTSGVAYDDDFSILSLSSRSISIDTEEEIKFADGVSLLKSCPACRTPFKKVIANLKGSSILLFLWVSAYFPLLIRTSFKSSYINYTESQPSLTSTADGLAIFIFGFIISVLLLSSEVMAGLKLIIEAFKGDSAKENMSDPEAVVLHKGRAVLHTDKRGLVLWTTLNNKLENQRPISLFKWIKSLTFVEFVLHLFYNFRWLLAEMIFLFIFFITIVISVVAAMGVNDSLVYLYTMHLMNGMGFPMYAVFLVKILYPLSVKGKLRAMLHKARGGHEEKNLMTSSGKELIKTPIFAFLMDKCVCNYAVDRSSKLPKQYRYSIRYHAKMTYMYKSAIVWASILYATFNFCVSTAALFTEITFRTVA